MNPLQKLLGISNKSQTVEVEITEPCMMDGVPYQPGDISRLSKRVAAGLVANGRAVDKDAESDAAAKRARLEKITPQMPERASMPESWKQHPECFAEWHELASRKEQLAMHVEATWKALEARMRSNACNMDLSTINNQSHRNREALAAAAISQIRVGAPSAQEVEELEHLRRCYHKADKALDAFEESNTAELAKLHLACSDNLLERNGETCRGIRELAALGYDIFSQRIAALGLGDQKARQLYGGSADHVKYGSIQEPSVPNLKLAWSGPGGPRYYFSRSPRIMVQMIEEYRKTDKEITRLTKEAKAELAKVQKISAAA